MLNTNDKNKSWWPLLKSVISFRLIKFSCFSNSINLQQNIYLVKSFRDRLGTVETDLRHL